MYLSRVYEPWNRNMLLKRGVLALKTGGKSVVYTLKIHAFHCMKSRVNRTTVSLWGRGWLGSPCDSVQLSVVPISKNAQSFVSVLRKVIWSHVGLNDRALGYPSNVWLGSCWTLENCTPYFYCEQMTNHVGISMTSCGYRDVVDNLWIDVWSCKHHDRLVVNWSNQNYFLEIYSTTLKSHYNTDFGVHRRSMLKRCEV